MAESQTVELLCGSGTEASVPKIMCLHDILIKGRANVLFVGEGNFTFTVAFAALREGARDPGNCINPGVWDGITSTCYRDTYVQPVVDAGMGCIRQIIEKNDDYILRTRFCR